MENWKNIENYPQYEVSDFGNVRRGSRYIKPWRQGKYLKISFSNNGIVTKEYIHRLVAIAFLGKPVSEKLDVAHNNGNPQDNRLSNLRWATRSENMADCVKHKTIARGEKNGHAKITANDVKEMRKLRAMGKTFERIAANYPICRQTVQDAVYGKNWKHV